MQIIIFAPIIPLAVSFCYLRLVKLLEKKKVTKLFCNDVKYYIPSPVDSILEAMLTVSPNKQYRGIVVPTTPATTGPDKINKILYHIFGSTAIKKLRFCFKFSSVNAHIYISMHPHLLYKYLQQNNFSATNQIGFTRLERYMCE